MSCIFRAIASFFFKRIMLGNQVRLQPDFTRDFSLHIHPYWMYLVSVSGSLELGESAVWESNPYNCFHL